MCIRDRYQRRVHGIQQMLKFRKFLPLLNRVLVEKSLPLTKTKAGIILPEKEGIKNFGKVVAVGPGALHEGKIIPVAVKVGQTVLLPEYSGSVIKLADEKEYAIYKDEDILGVLEDEDKQEIH
eukprot:TRINITY_DN1619_c0_g1_i4.p1 TRINITY_DN1619_c0_g1~~TRINITY_DN1619_c0_g1_i4.p1  ORF type:complete len:138 (+),score=48.48 TRINITY_DN1619_c0_g1_i4:48-416(+)